MSSIHSLENKTIVIKFGSSSVAFDDFPPEQNQIESYASDVAALLKRKNKVILVSSGAILAGRKLLKKNINSTTSLEELQALSALGQPRLMSKFAEEFNKKNLNIAQILLTHEDFRNKKRFLNAKNTIDELIKNNVVPILNENDTVSHEEISLGDNDRLAVMTENMVNADLLILLTQENGIFNRNQETQEKIYIKNVPFEHKINITVESGTAAGRGGIKAKLKAVNTATHIGIPVIISTFNSSNPLLKAVSLENGTYFHANPSLVNSEKKKWLLTIAKNNVGIIINKGAYEALKRDSSLLDAGVTNIFGRFQQGECVSIKYLKKIIAVGLAQKSSQEFLKFIKEKSNSSNGSFENAMAIHKNNLYLKD